MLARILTCCIYSCSAISLVTEMPTHALSMYITQITIECMGLRGGVSDKGRLWNWRGSVGVAVKNKQSTLYTNEDM